MPEKEIRNEISILSTDQAIDFVNRGMRRLDELSGAPIKPKEQDEDQPKTGNKVKLINPNTEQRATFTEFDKNRSGIESLLNRGFVVEESEGELPAWLFR